MLLNDEDGYYKIPAGTTRYWVHFIWEEGEDKTFGNPYKWYYKSFDIGIMEQYLWLVLLPTFRYNTPQLAKRLTTLSNITKTRQIIIKVKLGRPFSSSSFYATLKRGAPRSLVVDVVDYVCLKGH